MMGWQRHVDNMTPFRLKISEQDMIQLRELVFADFPNEAGAFALCGIARTSRSTDFIVRRVVAIPREQFQVQNEARLEIQAQAINGIIALCESNRLGIVICHSHPANSPYSPSDDFGEKRLFSTIRQFLPTNAPTISLLFYPDGVRGRVWLPGIDKPFPLTEIIALGRSIKHCSEGTVSHDKEAVEAIYNRQVLAFDRQGQILIGRSRVGIIGVGGTGSAIAEQLGRLGVRDVVLVDPDKFEDSNRTRMYGTYADSLRSPWWHFPKTRKMKVDLVAAHLRRINPQIQIKAVPHSVVLTDVAKCLLDRDILFLCTDEHWGRSIGNQIAYQYFIPAINVGMQIGAKDGAILGGVGIIDVLRPDTACLWCKEYLSAEQITVESMPHRDRKARQAEGYVGDIDTHQPSVVSITTTIAGHAVTAFLQLVTDFMGSSGNISRLNYNIMDGTVRRGTTTVADRCVCTKARGRGDLGSLPTVESLSFFDM